MSGAVSNLKGTSFPSFTIGKKGTTVYPSSTDPDSANTILTGDIWINTSTGEMFVWGDDNQWNEVLIANVSTIDGGTY